MAILHIRMLSRGITPLSLRLRFNNGIMTAVDLVSSRISIPADSVRDFCVRNHVRRLALFGSVLRDDFMDQSDVDVLIEYEPGRTPGLAFFGHQEELTEIFKRQVDLNTAGFLNPAFLDEVRAEALPLYESA